MAEVRKRETAYTVNIKDIITGEFVVMDGWDPNYVKTSFGLQVSRINVIGTVLEKQNNSIDIDDGTGIINCRVFEPFTPFENINIGDLVMIIGKIREFNEEIYILPETCKKIPKEWFDYRKKEIEKLKELFKQGKIKQEKKKISISLNNEVEEKEKIKETLSEEVISFMISEDQGDGVEKEKIIEMFKNKNIEKVFEKILNNGDIFEVKQGMYKVL